MSSNFGASPKMLKRLAEAAFTHMGLCRTEEDVRENSLLALCEGDYEFTESYFYHEFIFYWFTALELEARNKYLNKIRQLMQAEIGNVPVTGNEILAEMRDYALLLPETRMAAVGIQPTFPREKFEDWFNNRVDYIHQKLRTAVSDGIRAVPDRADWSAGLAPRLTPYHDYLGALSDGIVEGLGGIEDEIFTALLESAVLFKRQFMFGPMQETLDKALRGDSAG